MPSPDQEKTDDTGDTLDAEYKLVQPSQEPVPGMETYQSLARLLVGATILGGDELLSRVRAWEEQHSQGDGKTPSIEDETATDQLRYALVGLLFEAPETAARGVIRTAEMAESVAQSGERVLGPVLQSRLFGPVRRRGQKMQERVKTSVDRWVEVGRVEEVVGRDMAEDLTPQLLDPLVQKLGDQYIEYLRDDNPDQIQELIAGQTMGMTTEFANEVRQRTVTADSIAEKFARALLRRTPRQDLPEPPPDVQKQVTFKSVEEKREHLMQGEDND